MTGTASLVFEQDFTGTYAGDISGGRGSLTKLGTGKVILTGTNSYGFGTTVSGGILQGDTDSLQGSIVDNANVTFDQAADGTFSGNISGSGSLTKTGAGTLIFNSNNNYSGGTTIEDGLLQIGDANNQVSFAGAVVANGGGGFTVAMRTPARSRPSPPTTARQSGFTAGPPQAALSSSPMTAPPPASPAAATPARPI